MRLYFEYIKNLLFILLFNVKTKKLIKLAIHNIVTIQEYIFKYLITLGSVLV